MRQFPGENAGSAGSRRGDIPPVLHGGCPGHVAGAGAGFFVSAGAVGAIARACMLGMFGNDEHSVAVDGKAESLAALEGNALHAHRAGRQCVAQGADGIIFQAGDLADINEETVAAGMTAAQQIHNGTGLRHGKGFGNGDVQIVGAFTNGKRVVGRAGIHAMLRGCGELTVQSLDKMQAGVNENESEFQNYFKGCFSVVCQNILG